MPVLVKFESIQIVPLFALSFEFEFLCQKDEPVKQAHQVLSLKCFHGRLRGLILH